MDTAKPAVAIGSGEKGDNTMNKKPNKLIII